MIAGLILAAGESTRMGSDKALLVYHGRTFLETIVGNLREAGIKDIAVVLGHHAEEIRRAVNLAGVRVVINRSFREGQTSSLQAGLIALRDIPLEGVVLCLVDHPAVPASVITQLCDRGKLHSSFIAIPTFRGQHGHPVVISRALFPELLALGREEGANVVIRKYRAATRFVEVNDPSILLDIDDRKAYLRLDHE